ncbi:FAD-dependent oxidoreductase [Amycolatopsis acidicola]|uniref:FAD-dependent oxidoreductase n=1 Tax=Amycolatopsis acidicola TaxID=2596893 RepID=A0A5N0VMJ7_9PSEU|nr:FAD-dependent oxidoreductase [Amycolatopsis acidicola]KAA9166514.1 FAD-dependent oxidoreductase [Amycolatopsis acidicola]
MTELDADVCVVGGGPAGLTLALLLARSGVNVVVLERSAELNRAYWGEILQPGGLAILDSLGVLGPARERGGHELSRFQFLEHGKALLDIDYRALPRPHNYLLSMPQRHLLAALLDAARPYGNFRYHDRNRVTELIRENGRVQGVVARGPSGNTVVRARWVVGADGRFSLLRRLAGIPHGRQDVFDFDVVWVKLPAAAETLPYARILRSGGSPLLTYPSWPDSLQLGWTVPHGGYARMMAEGLDQVKAELARSAPPYASLIDAAITSVADLSLLDVFAARAPRWSVPGLVLIGDSAHTHSPIGAQGINLAIQDAAVLHPLLLKELRAPGAGAVEEFERRRGPDIARVLRVQAMQARGMNSGGRVARFVRPKATRILTRTPLFGRITREIVHGNPGIRVAAELFRPPEPAKE